MCSMKKWYYKVLILRRWKVNMLCYILANMIFYIKCLGTSYIISLETFIYPCIDSLVRYNQYVCKSSCPCLTSTITEVVSIQYRPKFTSNFPSFTVLKLWSTLVVDQISFCFEASIPNPPIYLSTAYLVLSVQTVYFWEISQGSHLPLKVVKRYNSLWT